MRGTSAIFFSVVVPQLLWMKAVRRSVIAAILVGISISAGVWFDRFSIIVGGLQHDYLPSLGRGYAPTLIETGLFFGTIGLFAALMLLFARTFPAISMFESRHDERQEGA